jgi:hypothetical protein
MALKKNSCQTGCFVLVLAFAAFAIWLCTSSPDQQRRETTTPSWTPKPYTSVAHSAAWQDGYEVGRLHYQNGEAFPGIMQQQNLRDLKGDEWLDGYSKGFLDAQSGK